MLRSGSHNIKQSANRTFWERKKGTRSARDKNTVKYWMNKCECVADGGFTGTLSERCQPKLGIFAWCFPEGVKEHKEFHPQALEQTFGAELNFWVAHPLLPCQQPKTHEVPGWERLSGSFSQRETGMDPLWAAQDRKGNNFLFLLVSKGWICLNFTKWLHYVFRCVHVSVVYLSTFVNNMCVKVVRVSSAVEFGPLDVSPLMQKASLVRKSPVCHNIIFMNCIEAHQRFYQN